VPDRASTDRASAGPAGATAGRPAYYAARPGGWRDWWTLLHPPYTAWHLSYVVIGAALAPRVSVSHLLYTVAAFFLAVGVAAHALDELNGRPLRTSIPGWALITAAVVSLAGAVGLGVYGITQTGWILLPFMVAGPVLVVAYNAELFGGIIHNDLGFAAAWGAFPALTGYAAQDGTLGLAAIGGAAAALALSAAQRRLSTPARSIRRRAVEVRGTITLADGSTAPIGPDLILTPLEGALRAMSWGLILLAAAMAVARLR
jgi:voltage-gated potassium channel Kch